MRALVLIVLLTLIPQRAFAEPPVPAPLTPVPPGNDVIDVVKAGQSAPHDGQLFDQQTAIRWANYLQQCQARLRLDPLYQYKLDQADLVAAQKKLDLQQAEYTRVTTLLQNKITSIEETAVNPPFYKTFWFGAAVGVVLSVVLVAGSVAVLNATK